MGVFTTEGFIRAVFDKYCKRNGLMIRAGCKDDLVRLPKKLPGFADGSAILEWSDYLLNYALNIISPMRKTP
jgi:hypothetical protein